MKQKTLDFYNEHVSEYVQDTLYVDFSSVQDIFLQYVKKGGHILDLGCGTGRDSKYFLDKGYVVDAIDGSIELCKFASEFIGIEVKHQLFQELNVSNQYDAIWASACLLHLKYEELDDVFCRIYNALKQEGIFYCSFKYGDYEGYRGNRYFTDLTEETLNTLLKGFVIVKQWISEDVRNDQTQLWLNVICKKDSAC